MIVEVWYKIFCGCGEMNWICDGDPQDTIGVGMDGYMCRACGTRHPMIKDEPGDIDSYEVGLEKPE